MYPADRSYTKDHEWVRVANGEGSVGITDYAQQQLGTISAVELPGVGDELEQDDSFGSVEARKTVAELYAPVGGTVTEVNEELADTPELVNDDPYDGGWLVAVVLGDPEELNLLLSADDYQEFLAEKEE